MLLSGRSLAQKQFARQSTARQSAADDMDGTLAYWAYIPGYTIGAIQIQEQYTLVDVPEQYVDQVLDKAGTLKIQWRPIMLERA